MSLSGVRTCGPCLRLEPSSLDTGNYLYVITVGGDDALHLFTDIDDESLCLSGVGTCGLCLRLETSM